MLLEASALAQTSLYNYHTCMVKSITLFFAELVFQVFPVEGTSDGAAPLAGAGSKSRRVVVAPDKPAAVVVQGSEQPQSSVI